MQQNQQNFKPARPLVFRAWERVLKLMLPITEFYFQEGKVQLRGERNRTDISYVEIMQFTGLKDKGGLEIYEGDAMKFPWFPDCFFIEWHDGAFWAIYKQGSDDFQLDSENASGALIVGNIYENPELVPSV